MIRLLIEDMLDDLGHTLAGEASSISEALTLAREAEFDIAILDVDLNGTTVGTQYDQQNVTGTVALGGATLNLTLGITPAAGNTFTIIKDTGGLSGNFTNLNEGTVFTVTTGSFTGTFQITYQGGAGGHAQPANGFSRKK